MTIARLQNYALGEWVAGTGAQATLLHAVTGEPVAETSTNRPLSSAGR